MKIYRITYKVKDVKNHFITRAQSTSQAISKWLIAVKDTSFYDENIINVFNKIVEESIVSGSNDVLLFENDDLMVECVESMEIDMDLTFYDDEDSSLYTYQHLSDSLKTVITLKDVSYILSLEFDYMLDNGFISDTNEESPQNKNLILDTEDLSYYIQKEALKSGIVYSSEHICDILEAELEYMKAVGIIKDDKFNDAINLDNINFN